MGTITVQASGEGCNFKCINSGRVYSLSELMKLIQEGQDCIILDKDGNKM